MPGLLPPFHLQNQVVTLPGPDKHHLNAKPQATTHQETKPAI
jgi:hypothetical protein